MIGIVILLIISMQDKKEISDKKYGKGQGSNLIVPKKTSSADFNIGRYHSFYWDGQSPAYISTQTEFNLADWPFGDAFNELDYAIALNEPVSQSRSEMVIVVFNIYNLYSGGTVTFEWYKEEGDLWLNSIDYYIPNPSQEYWSWYSVMSWMGHFPCEINEVGRYYVDILSPWHSQRLYFDVTGTPYVDFSSHKSFYLSGYGSFPIFIADANEWIGGIALNGGPI